MSVLCAAAWRILHALLCVQRVVFSWVSWWSWKFLLPPRADMRFVERTGGKSGQLHGAHGYVAKQCDCADLRHRCDMNYLTQQRMRSWRADGCTMPKLPVHIGLLMGEESQSYTDVANLVVWCMAVGISYISVYDHQGIFKQNSSRLLNEVFKQRKELLGNEYSKYHLENGNDNSDQAEKATSRLPLLKVLAPEDGKTQIVKAAQSFCRLVAHDQKKPTEMSVGALDRLLRSTHNFPDPELILKFGSINSTLGFLPWHIRLSEIISLPSHLNIRYEDFFSALASYANCEQRFGK
ncbi:hypothetical protein GDO86_009689 [Hymenochirus boettgeri]|uniref:ditrans,polycis-polyprenyl diphosphate synthase [(2E,6E)-farnesyldiphosphate specific] n=1 Tax=Hymenochirus boettgeri TaxID=247094 RepID=A0A8T2JHG2_9PIPI|nr:hypothetical protein GDO86_009689 [Hymenochirus boettgeri]KAG8444620.1 hypothetical protein GDO86_009689 [Hymenochirus boettgeri]KAG8444621.1 hypothetical protein GDO86_009689 [Hymenochirus boettgeri]